MHQNVGFMFHKNNIEIDSISMRCALRRGVDRRPGTYRCDASEQHLL